MAKMIIALALAAPSALAFTHYVPNTDEPTPAPANGCGDPCADVITLDEISGPFDTIEDSKCYVVDGTFQGIFDRILVPSRVDCAKITVPSGSSLGAIIAHPSASVLSLNRAPRNAETRRAQVDGDNTEIVNEGEVNAIQARLPRPLLFALCGA